MASVGRTSNSLKAFAALTVLMGAFLSSPYALASVWSSLRIRAMSFCSDPRSSSRVFLSVASSSCSLRIFISSSLARWRSLRSRMASAWISVSLNRSIKAAFGLSSFLIISMTSSRFR